MLSDDELLAQVLAVFLEEQAEQRQTIGSIVLELEQHPQRQSRELLEQLFREAHSLKGGARAAGVPQIEVIAHQMEDLFSAVRSGALQLAPDVCDAIHAALDAIGQLVAQITAGKEADLAPHQALLAQLKEITERGSTPHASNGEDPASSAEPADGVAPVERTEVTTVRLATETLDQLIREVGDLLASSVRSRQRGQEIQGLLTLPERWHRIWRETTPALKRMLRHSEALVPTVHYLDGWQPLLPQRRNQLKTKDVEQVNAALTTAHEVISQLEERLQLLFSHQREDQLQLASVTERLHDQVRRTRMAPLALVLNPLRIQLRELARAAEKQVQLSIHGSDAEADRQVLDELREVLLHLLRNAVDHGIEHPEARQAAGKPAEGQITITAMVIGDHLQIEVTDDGSGLDIEAIQQRAAELRVRSPEELELLNSEQLMGLIFEPGFSTRNVVSALSGRGVGLDVVRSQVERMRGQIRVNSTIGMGSRFTLTVPLSLTSGQYLLVQLGGQQEQLETTLAALPLEAVQQIITVAVEDLRSTEGRPLVRYQGRPLPVATLADLLGLGAPLDLGSAGRALGLVLGSADRQLVGLVAAVVDTQELVIQRLPAPLTHVPGIAGAAILADGQPVPLLDPIDLLRSASRSKPLRVRDATPKAHHRAHIVVVDDSITTRTLEKHVLEGAGYQVSLATNGLEALTLLQQLTEQGGCDLLLTDVDMPKLNGFDLTARVRAHHQLSQLPIVLVTSLDRPADRERGLAVGADAYIVKRHFDHQYLLETIARLIS